MIFILLKVAHPMKKLTMQNADAIHKKTFQATYCIYYSVPFHLTLQQVSH